MSVIAGLVLLFGLAISKVIAEWGVQPQEMLTQLSQTSFNQRPPNGWAIAGRETRAEPQGDALGASSVYLHERNGSLENGPLALIQYFVMKDPTAARRGWEQSVTDMRTAAVELGPRRVFRVKGLGYPHLCVDESEGDFNNAYCQVLVGDVWYEAFDRSSGLGACDCVTWMTRAAAHHLEEAKTAVGLW